MAAKDTPAPAKPRQPTRYKVLRYVDATYNFPEDGPDAKPRRGGVWVEVDGPDGGFFETTAGKHAAIDYAAEFDPTADSNPDALPGAYRAPNESAWKDGKVIGDRVEDTIVRVKATPLD